MDCAYTRLKLSQVSPTPAVERKFPNGSCVDHSTNVGRRELHGRHFALNHDRFVEFPDPHRKIQDYGCANRQLDAVTLLHLKAFGGKFDLIGARL